MKAGYRHWLEEQKYAANTITAQMHRAGRVEEHHGNLDEHYDKDRLASLIDLLRYSNDDQRHNRPNPSKIPFDGNIRNNLASYRNAVERYRKFRDAAGDSVDVPDAEEARADLGASSVAEEVGQRIGLERDLQAALRIEIEQLEPGLTVIDDGAERSVDSGFIDITACCLLQQTTIRRLATARVKHAGVPLPDVESRSPGGVQNVKTAFRGVHRRPNRVTLSLLFLVFLPVSD
jgi:hypothetical protein